MRAYLIAILTILFITPTLAHIASPEPAANGHVITLEIAAPSLQGNLLKTASQQIAHVYLPPSYNQNSNRRYPVVYLLHGIFDSGKTWINFTDIPNKLDQLIASGKISEVIAVMPDAGNVHGGGFYRNSSVAGNWEDYVVDDLIQTIDARYRTIAKPGGRAVIGHSMGGYGAIHLAMQRPGVFSVVYAIAPAALDLTEDLNFGNAAWKRVAAFEELDELEAAVASFDFWAVAPFSILTSFNPDPDNPPFYTRFPFQIVRGEVVLDQTEYNELKMKFPLHHVANSWDAFKSLRAFGIEYGVSDQFLHIPVAIAAFSSRLNEYRIPHRLEVLGGDHRNQLKARIDTVILPYVVNALDQPE